jgi:hypothetical protein
VRIQLSEQVSGVLSVNLDVSKLLRNSGETSLVYNGDDAAFIFIILIRGFSALLSFVTAVGMMCLVSIRR